MEPIFIYFNKLKFDKDKKFTLSFSDDDKIKSVIFKKCNDYFIVSMDCYIKLSNDIKNHLNTKK